MSVKVYVFNVTSAVFTKGWRIIILNSRVGKKVKQFEQGQET